MTGEFCSFISEPSSALSRVVSISRVKCSGLSGLSGSGIADGVDGIGSAWSARLGDSARSLESDDGCESLEPGSG